MLFIRLEVTVTEKQLVKLIIAVRFSNKNLARNVAETF